MSCVDSRLGGDGQSRRQIRSEILGSQGHQEGSRLNTSHGRPARGLAIPAKL